MTIGPSWFIPPTQHFVSDPALLDDPSTPRSSTGYETMASSCVRAAMPQIAAMSFYDIDAPGSWTTP